MSQLSAKLENKKSLRDFILLLAGIGTSIVLSINGPHLKLAIETLEGVILKNVD